MACKIRLVDGRGCGAPPFFDQQTVTTTSVPLKLTLSDITAVVNDCNAWIEEQWTSWWNFGWLFLGCFFVRFVRNDMLFRAPLRAFLAERTALLVERSGATFELYRKVKTYGYGETSKTVVKVSLVIVDAFASPDLFEEIAGPALREEMAELRRSAMDRRNALAPRVSSRAVSSSPSMEPIDAGSEGTDSVALRPMAPSPAAPPASVLVATTPSPLEPPLRTYTHTAGPVPFDEEESG